MSLARALALAALVLPFSIAADTPGRMAVAARRHQLDALLAAYKLVKRELAEPDPDLAIIRLGSARMAGLARQLPAWFPSGSGPESGAETSAKPEIWSNFADFRAKSATMNQTLIRLTAAAERGDIAPLRERFREVSEACTACHRIYEERF